MSLIDSIDPTKIPTHVAIIMDGNGRWAVNKKKPRSFGHKEGLEVTKKILYAAKKIGIKYITFYVFSTENWKRTEEEVSYLMTLINTHLNKEYEFYKKNGIKLAHIGNLNGLPQSVQSNLKKAINDCKDFKDITAVLAINYGGRDEIIRAIQKNVKNIEEKNFSTILDYPELPDVDLLIRTGGEKRLSNFLLWQSAYAELEFSDALWPDYTEEEFYTTILNFQKRNRRFGGY